MSEILAREPACTMTCGGRHHTPAGFHSLALPEPGMISSVSKHTPEPGPVAERSAAEAPASAGPRGSTSSAPRP